MIINLLANYNKWLSTMHFILSDPIYSQHDTGPGHPEQPARTLIIDQALTLAGYKTPANTLKPRKAKESEILLCHTKSYFDLVCQEIQDLETSGASTLSTGDVEISTGSLEAALFAAGGALTAIDAVMKHPRSTVFCNIRPPGHHACSSIGMGFCLFNNAAIAARYAQQKYQLRKVLIADWDVHHGNGTQEIFYDDPSVFYFSTHEKNLYPFTGTEEETGEGKGEGTTLNCPILPGPQARVDVLEAFNTSLRKRMESFRPDLVIISAGFDAHDSDPLGHFNLTDQDFFDLTRICKEIADKYAEGRIISVLEGGYNLRALVSASISHVKALTI